MSDRDQRSRRRDNGPPGRQGDRRRLSRHDEAVIQAEVRRLARTLRPYGALRRDALEEVVGQERGVVAVSTEPSLVLSEAERPIRGRSLLPRPRGRALAGHMRFG